MFLFFWQTKLNAASHVTSMCQMSQILVSFHNGFLFKLNVNDLNNYLIMSIKEKLDISLMSIELIRKTATILI